MKNKGKQERLSKEKLLKCCHWGRNVTVLAILERQEFNSTLILGVLAILERLEFSLVLIFGVYLLMSDFSIESIKTNKN